jgi:hypothetical protein
MKMTTQLTRKSFTSTWLFSALALTVPAGIAAATTAVVFIGLGTPDDWAVHDMNRPQPTVVTAGTNSCGTTAGTAPSDAVVLFDGTNLDAFQTGGGPAKWTVKDGVAIVNGGDIQTRNDFGDVQMHIEWMIPADRETNGQGGGNSGVFFNNQYEVQILNAFENETYPDGTAGSFYGQHPPLVNPCRPKGEWNVYDIIYTAPRWDAEGTLTAPGRATVIFNGVVVQNNQAFWGSTAHMRKATYGAPHGPGPIRIQDHGDPIRFQNIWVRPLDG